MDPADLGLALVKLVAMPYGSRPFRVTVDPSDGGAEEINKSATAFAPPILRAPAWPIFWHPTRRG